MIKDNVRSVIEKYLLKNPDLTNFSAIADLILEDGASNLSHRTIRLYAAEVQKDLESGQTTIPFDDPLLELDEPTSFQDITLDPPEIIVKKPKLLYLDIETARMQVGVWDISKTQYINPDQIIKTWFIYGWAARWYGSSDTLSSFVTPEEAIARDDKRIMGDIWPLLEEAHAVITHNGEKFDIPKIKTRCLINGLSPFSSFRSIDTYRMVSKQMSFASNALKYLSTLLTEKRKMETKYQLWIECEQGVAESLAYMKKYCIGDIDALEEVYLMLRPWFKSHPNLSVFTGAPNACCPNCASEDLTMIDSTYTTQQNAFPEIRCNTCGAVNRAKDTLISTAKRKAMIVPAAH